MATYINIHGNNIPIRASDPSNPVQGEIWYNTTTNSLKGQGFSSGSWSSGGNLPTGRSANSGSGSTPAGFSMGGGTGPVASYVSATNTYNGTAWTAGGAMTHTAAYAAACGTIPTTIYAGGDGNAPGASNTYNGTAWTSIAALGFDGYQLKGAGDKANAFMAQGYYSATGRLWNGSSWTTKSSVPQHNYSTSAVGTYNDASFLGGIAVSSGPGNVHLNWDGSAWNTRTVMPVSGGAGGVSSNAAPTSDFWVQATAPTTLNWNGSSWTTVGSLSTVRSGGASSGSSSAEGFLAGGTPGNLVVTEEFASGPVTKTISTS
tara:strand:- start:100 stop:1050 length:951 start_codon:yes stop_codon:yes gene_type:complete